jgi:hypothetical protein
LQKSSADATGTVGSQHENGGLRVTIDILHHRTHGPDLALQMRLQG